MPRPAHRAPALRPLLLLLVVVVMVVVLGRLLLERSHRLLLRVLRLLRRGRRRGHARRALPRERPQAEPRVLATCHDGVARKVDRANQPLVARLELLGNKESHGFGRLESSSVGSAWFRAWSSYLGDGHQPAHGLHLEERDAALDVARGEEEAVSALRPVVVVLHRELGRRGLCARGGSNRHMNTIIYGL